MYIRSALIVAATAAFAPTTATASLQDLFDGGCVSGFGIRACNWQLEYDISDVVVDFDNIDVFVEEKGTDRGIRPSISYLFNGELDVDNGDGILFGYTYSLFVHGGTLDAGLELTDVVFAEDPDNPDFPLNSGFVQVTESIFYDNQLIAELVAEVDPQFGIDDNPVWADLYHPYKNLWIEKDIVVQSDGFAVSLGDMHQYVPVPATLVLLGGGLAVLAAVRRRGAGRGAAEPARGTVV